MNEQNFITKVTAGCLFSALVLFIKIHPLPQTSTESTQGIIGPPAQDKANKIHTFHKANEQTRLQTMTKSELFSDEAVSLPAYHNTINLKMYIKYI